MTTLPWSSLVGQVWRPKNLLGVTDDLSVSVVVAAHHTHADLVHVRSVNDPHDNPSHYGDDPIEWLKFADFKAFYEPACCTSCGAILTRQHLESLRALLPTDTTPGSGDLQI
jgi:hypothetical protein